MKVFPNELIRGFLYALETNINSPLSKVSKRDVYEIPYTTIGKVINELLHIPLIREEQISQFYTEIMNIDRNALGFKYKHNYYKRQTEEFRKELNAFFQTNEEFKKTLFLETIKSHKHWDMNRSKRIEVGDSFCFEKINKNYSVLVSISDKH